MNFSDSINFLQEPKFIVDFMCGRLARWLRILGFDTEYYTKKNQRGKILLQSLKEQRIVLTRDTKLSKKKAYKLILITSDKIRDQIKQVVKETNLKIDEEKLFSRCSICNKIVVLVENKDKVKHLVPPYVFETQKEFYTCPICNRVYWQGSHYELFLNEIKSLFNI